MSEVQRARIMSATVALVAEVGYARMSVDRVARRAGVSRRTFYECFKDREDCFLAVFDEGVGRMATAMGTAYDREVGWPARVRAALGALLALLEYEPHLSTLVFVESLAAGPKILEHRGEVLRKLKIIFEGVCCELKTVTVKEVSECSPLTAEAAVNGILGILHTRLVDERSPIRHPPLVELVGPLTAMIALPYIGHAAVAQELSRPELSQSSGAAGASKTAGTPAAAGASDADPSAVTGVPGRQYRVGRSPLEGLEMRVTYRTLRVLTAIAELDGRGLGPSNRQIADEAGIRDPGQISRLLARLTGLGLIEKLGRGHAQGGPNAWRLTDKGEEVRRAIEGRNKRESRRSILLPPTGYFPRIKARD